MVARGARVDVVPWNHQLDQVLTHAKLICFTSVPKLISFRLEIPSQLSHYPTIPAKVDGVYRLAKCAFGGQIGKGVMVVRMAKVDCRMNDNLPSF